MTLEEPLLIFIPRISSSKEPRPPRWLCLALIQLKGKTKESREWGVAQCGVCWEGGLPLYLYMALRRCSGYSWCEAPGCTTLAWSHATAYRRRGWGAPAGGQPPPTTGRPLTAPPRHRLCVAGHGLVMDHCSMGFYPIWIKLMAVSLVPLRKSASESAFWWFIPCICVCDMQNDVLQIHVKLG